MKIGVTGGTGLIGQQLLKEYADGNVFLVVTAQRNVSQYFQHEHVQYRFSDYSTKSLCEHFKDCECLVHLGAKKSSAIDEESIEQFYVNISFAETVFKAAHALNIPNVINISSRCVYSPSLVTPYQETITLPLNNYGIAKLCTENIAELYNQKYAMNIKSLRVAQVISKELGDNSLFSAYLRQSLAGEMLYVFGEGKSSKEYIYIKDVCAAIISGCCSQNLKGSFNIGTGITTSNKELAEMICKVFHNQKGYCILKEKREDQLYYLMDVSKAERTLKFKNKFSLTQALEDIKKEMGKLRE